MPATDGFSLATWIVRQNISDADIIMMLTFPHLRRKQELEKLGITTSVLKPVGALELETVILNFLGIAKPEPDLTVKAPQRVIRVPSRPLKILVAEDTPFNQKFILRLLERWNHQATLVENGRQALEASNRDTFDIVLMDVQMPEMDGLEATRKIREREDGMGKSEGERRNAEKELKAQSSKPEVKELEVRGQNTNSASRIPPSDSKRIPIIAMTAHVIKGDRERCLEAGMDEYVSKPIDSDKLFEAIETLTRGPDISKAAAGPVALDNKLLLKAFDGDWDFLKEVVEVFLDDYPRLLDTLRRSFNEGDSDTFMRSAHSLKGMLKNFQAETAAEVAFDLEKKGKEKDLDGVQADIESLADQIVEVDKMLRGIIEHMSN